MTSIQDAIRELGLHNSELLLENSNLRSRVSHLERHLYLLNETIKRFVLSLPEADRERWIRLDEYVDVCGELPTEGYDP